MRVPLHPLDLAWCQLWRPAACAASESDAPLPVEVPLLLQQLDVVRQREEQEAKDLRLHGRRAGPWCAGEGGQTCRVSRMVVAE